MVKVTWRSDNNFSQIDLTVDLTGESELNGDALTLRGWLASTPFISPTPDNLRVEARVALDTSLIDKDQVVDSFFMSRATETSPGEGQETFVGWSAEPIIAFTGLEERGYTVDDFIIGHVSSSDLVSGDERHEGNELSNRIASGDGDDTVSARAGDDRVQGGNGDDLIYGHTGEDTLFGGAGENEIYGNQGVDWLYGGEGNDRLFGGQNGGEPTQDARGNLKMQEGEEHIIGLNGNDLIYGNFGRDIIWAGNDSVNGVADDDLVFGGQGDDLIFGSSGDDTIWGQRGDDQLTGGSGADFFFINGGGVDRITDFSPASGDFIVSIRRFVTDIEVEDDASGAALKWDTGNETGTLILEGIDPDSFSNDWFLTP